MKPTPYERVPAAIREAAEQVLVEATVGQHTADELSAAWSARVLPLIEAERDRVARLQAEQAAQRAAFLAAEQTRVFGTDPASRIRVELLKPLRIVEHDYDQGEHLEVDWRFGQKLLAAHVARRAEAVA